MRRIVGELWFTQAFAPVAFGVVVTEEEGTKERFAYIGACDGKDGCADVQAIRRNGAKLQLQDLKTAIGLLEGTIERASCHTDHKHEEGDGS